jgi:hypothetical protein
MGLFCDEPVTAEPEALQREAVYGRAGGRSGRVSPPSAKGVRDYNPRKIFEITDGHR